MVASSSMQRWHKHHLSTSDSWLLLNYHVYSMCHSAFMLWDSCCMCTHIFRLFFCPRKRPFCAMVHFQCDLWSFLCCWHFMWKEKKKLWSDIFKCFVSLHSRSPEKDLLAPFAWTYPRLREFAQNAPGQQKHPLFHIIIMFSQLLPGPGGPQAGAQ